MKSLDLTCKKFGKQDTSLAMMYNVLQKKPDARTRKEL